MKDESQNEIDGSFPEEDWNSFQIPEVDEDVQEPLDEDIEVGYPFPEIDTITSIQQYYDELESIANKRALTLGGRLLPTDLGKRTLALQMDCVIAPLVHCIEFILSKRPWGKYFSAPTASPFLKVTDSRKLFSTDRLLYGLMKLKESELKTLLSELRCDEEVYNNLVHSVLSRDYVQFDNAMKVINLTSLSELCQKYVFTPTYYSIEELDGILKGELKDMLMRSGWNLGDYSLRYQSVLRGRNPFSAYVDCRRFIEMAGGYLSYGESTLLSQILNRKEGKELQDRFEKRLKENNENNPEEDEKVENLILPQDFFTNPKYIDPSIPVIGKLPEWFIAGGPIRLEYIVDYLADEQFGYLKPTIGNKRLLASRLTGRKLSTSYTTIHWILKVTQKVPDTEKVVLWLMKYIFDGKYEKAYSVLNLDEIIENRISVQQRTNHISHADPDFVAAIEGLYSYR